MPSFWNRTSELVQLPFRLPEQRLACWRAWAAFSDPLQVWRSLTRVEFRGYSSIRSRSKNEKTGPVGEVGTKSHPRNYWPLIAAGRETFKICDSW